MHVGIANPRWRGKRSGHSRRKPKRNDSHFADNIFFKCNLLNKNLRILIPILLKLVTRDPVHKTSLVQVMAWRRAGDRPLPQSTITPFADACMCDHIYCAYLIICSMHLQCCQSRQQIAMTSLKLTRWAESVFG